MNLDLHKIESITFIFFVMLIVSVICPGILFVFIFGRDLFISTETLKLILLSISITTPIWLLNSFIVSLIAENDDEDEKEAFQMYSIIGSMISMPVVYLPIAVKIFWDITLQVGVAISFAMEIIVLIFLSILEMRSRKRKHRK